MSKRRFVRIEYTLKPDADLAEVKSAIEAFVAGIHAHDAGSEYTSYQRGDDPRKFIHIGSFAEEVVADLQAQPFFKKFRSFLPERCVAPPTATPLSRVASTP